MARKVIDIIYNLVRRRLAQSGAYDRGSGITSLPDPKAVESGMQQVFKQLKDGNPQPSVPIDNTISVAFNKSLYCSGSGIGGKN